MPNSLNNVLSTVVMSLLATPLFAAPPALPDVLRAASRDGRFVRPSADELARASRLFGALAQGDRSAPLENDAAELDLELLRVSQPDAWVLREKATAKRGRGLYAFRAGGRDTLEVPHSFKDEMTREIGLALFAEGQFAAAAWNTVPRHYEENGRRVDADMAHLDQTYFMAFTRAVAATHAGDSILQIHGFDQGKRKSAAAADAELILSAGHGQPGERLRRQWQCLGARFGGKVALYPETARELGGTGNAQVAMLRGLRFDHFIHAEISRPLRETLRDSSRDRAQFLGCVQGGG